MSETLTGIYWDAEDVVCEDNVEDEFEVDVESRLGCCGDDVNEINIRDMKPGNI